MVLIHGPESATSHHIASLLRDEILEGKYPPGTRISQESVAQKYESSRSPVKDAFRILESEGLLLLVAHTGAWISELSLVECEEMYQIREQIEPLMLRMSIPNLTKKQIETLGSLLQELDAVSSVEEFLKLDREFHLLTYAGASTAFLGNMVTRMWNTTQHYRRAYSMLLEKENFKSAHCEHYLLLSALERGDIEGAEQVLYGHIRHTRIELAKHLEIFS